ncbi:hypothetical protein B0H63DRAFT_400548 [Podospora didyma]|uniref:Uncharacterized protein n=1 Tax=Podospora didyma TaxID=330526 RepID=A0AAE0KEW7_9PEZI|nr:hypothetical protein B0H63DRAFT_400548 [Podospora didyma]
MMSPRSFLVTRQTQLHTSTQTTTPPSTQRPPASTSSPSPSSSPALHPTAQRKNDRFADDTPFSTSPSSATDLPATMPSKRREMDAKSPTLSPPRATTILTRPTTPSNPVQIPMRPKSRDTSFPQQKQQRHHGERRPPLASHRPRDVHSPDAIPASVAALLAITSIPPSRSSRSMRQAKSAREKRMTVESIIERSQESEKELSISLSKSPLDLLLMPPEESECDDVSSLYDSNMGSALSTRTVSLESMPSLADSFATDTLSSLESPHTPGRRRKARPTRRSLEPVSSPPGELEDHPLSSPLVVAEELDFSVFEHKAEELQDKKASRMPFKPLKSAFKSNLTASLRALRQAARSFSNLNFPLIPPEDFLTRSILTLDPQVPYTDERRPPPLEEEPTAELRRYLNPTTTVRLEKPSAAAAGPATRTFTASIQMQTYKVHRARSAPPSGRGSYPSVGPSSASQSQSQSRPQSQQAAPHKSMAAGYPMPGPRQREMRENSDFIRIAVMEMAMRKRGKLDDQRPGRARWALPPRKTSPRPYEIGADGVPARWVAISY